MHLFAYLLLPCALLAQESPPAFEVATVKANNIPNAGNGFYPTPGRLRITAMTLEQLIQAAFHIKTGLLFGVSPRDPLAFSGAAAALVIAAMTAAFVPASRAARIDPADVLRES